MPLKMSDLERIHDKLRNWPEKPYSDFQSKLEANLWVLNDTFSELMLLLKEEASAASSPTTELHITASPWEGAQQVAGMIAAMQQSLPHLGIQHPDVSSHVAQCSECQVTLEPLMSLLWTYAPDVVGAPHWIFQKQELNQSASEPVAVGLTLPLLDCHSSSCPKQGHAWSRLNLEKEPESFYCLLKPDEP